MDKPKMTPKDFFLWAGAMVSLYAGVVAFITLLFEYINYTFPDPLKYYANPYEGGIAYSMASLIVLTPVFLMLMRTIRRNIQRDPSRAEIWVRRWALYLTVFAAGATIVADLIVLLNAFLRGEEITVAFLLKVVVVLLVVGAGFMHFLADLWGYWARNPGRARLINYGVGILVIAAIAAGFLIVGTPGQAREYRQDDQKVSDLQQIQSQIVYYYQLKQRLPAALGELEDPVSGIVVPFDKETGEPYEYTKTGALAFELCATFNKVSLNGSGATLVRPEPVGLIYGTEENWQHEAGRQCFARTIDPERYPLIDKRAYPTAY